VVLNVLQRCIFRKHLENLLNLLLGGIHGSAFYRLRDVLNQFGDVHSIELYPVIPNYTHFHVYMPT
jgi:hypothetical protein